jgi:hypothetical protein
MKKRILLPTGICLLLMTTIISPIYAQDTNNQNSNFSFGAEVVSRYVWRGINLGGSTPHVQPWAEYSFGETGLALGAWGSYSLGAGAGTEADLYLSYTPIDWLNITVTDYFFPADEPFERSDYFNYKKDETGHTIEAMLTLGGSDNFPFYATFAMNIYGADGVDARGKNLNAKYLELGYNSTIWDYDISAFAGACLDNPDTDNGGEGWYGDSAGLINLGVSIGKPINIGTLSIPVSTSLVFNPEAGNIFIVLGISF